MNVREIGSGFRDVARDMDEAARRQLIGDWPAMGEIASAITPAVAGALLIAFGGKALPYPLIAAALIDCAADVLQVGAEGKR
jgi:hypothetical protein